MSKKEQIGGKYFGKLNEDIRNINRNEVQYCLKKCFLSAKIKDNTLLQNFFIQKIEKLVENTNLERMNYPTHFTLFGFEINISHPLNKGNNKVHDPNNKFAYKNGNERFLSKNFKEFIVNELKEYLFETLKETIFSTTKIEFIGDKKQFLVQNLKLNFWLHYTYCTKYFYNAVEAYIKKFKPTDPIFKIETVEDITYNVLYIDKIPFIAIQDYYYDWEITKPHVTLAIKKKKENSDDYVNVPDIQDIEGDTKINFKLNEECFDIDFD
jgi:hypothetical protein